MDDRYLQQPPGSPSKLHESWLFNQIRQTNVMPIILLDNIVRAYSKEYFGLHRGLGDGSPPPVGSRHVALFVEMKSPEAKALAQIISKIVTFSWTQFY